MAAFKQQIQGKIVCEYLEKYGRDMMKLTLSRLIYAENSDVFASVDGIRRLINYYTKASGVKARMTLHPDHNFEGYCQPVPTQSVPREDFVLPTTCNNILFLSDIHVTFHDNLAIDAALAWGKDKRINTIIIGGDFMDFYALSKFLPDPRMRNLRWELDCGYEMMYRIASYLPNAKIYFLPGNHELRLERYLSLKAPELLGAEPGISDLDFFLKLSDFGVTYLRNMQLIQAGQLFIGHGHEFRGGAGGVNPARTFTLKTKANYLGGHFHRTSENSDKKLSGEIEACWSVGCLCGLHPDYMPYNNWNHGFAHIRVMPDRTFKVFNARIFNGKVL